MMCMQIIGVTIHRLNLDFIHSSDLKLDVLILVMYAERFTTELQLISY